MASVLLGAAGRRASVNTLRFTKCASLSKQIHVSAPAQQPSEQASRSDVANVFEAQALPQKTTKPVSKYWISRERKFNEMLQFVGDRTGRVKVVKAGQVQAKAWLRLLQLASKPQHVEAIVDTFPKWREAGKSFTSLDAEMFVRRCEELDCPLLALKVFSDHPKYGFPLSSFAAARNLLYALYQKYPLQHTITAVSLFGLNNLPAVTLDPVCTAMLYSACLRSTNKHAASLGKDMRMALMRLLGETEPFAEPTEWHIRSLHSVKPNLWLLEALRDIKRVKKEQGRGAWWISEWLAQGEGRELPPLAVRRRQARIRKNQDATAVEAEPQQPLPA